MSRAGRAHVLTRSLEAERIAKALPGVQLLRFEELGLFELMEDGMAPEEAELETVVRAVTRWQTGEAVVPRDLPVAVADRRRAGGVRLQVDGPAVDARRRVKSAAELEGIRRAQRAAAGAPAPPDVMVASALTEGAGHDPDSGPLGATCRSSSTSGRATSGAAAGRT